MCSSGNTQKQSSGSSKGAGNGTGKRSGKGKGKGKRRASETCMCCGKGGHKNADSKFRTAACSNCGKIVHLRAVCQNTNTHEIDEYNDENRPQVIVEAVWCMSVQSIVEDDGYVHSEKLEESSEHRDAYTLKALSRTSRWIKHFGKVITNIETNQNCENVVESIETDQHCGKFVESIGTDRHLEKWFRSSRWMAQAKTVSETL